MCQYINQQSTTDCLTASEWWLELLEATRASQCGGTVEGNRRRTRSDRWRLVVEVYVEVHQIPDRGIELYSAIVDWITLN